MSTVTKRELREQRRAERRPLRRPRPPCAAAAARLLGGAAAGGDRRRRRRDRPASGGAAPKVKPVESSLLAGIPERDGVLGDPKATVTVTEFLDLQCPICAEASKQTLPTPSNDYVRTGKVKLQAGTLHFIGPDSDARRARGRRRRAAGPAVAVRGGVLRRPGPENSGYVTDGFLRDVAEAAGVDAGKAVDAADGASPRAWRGPTARPRGSGVNSTPTHRHQGPAGRRR